MPIANSVENVYDTNDMIPSRFPPESRRIIVYAKEERGLKIGLDVGSTTIKCVVLDSADNIVYSTYERHFSHILEKSEELLRRVAGQ